MADFLTAMTALFTFLITQLGNIATFFVTNTLGQIILGISLFAVVFWFISLIISHIKN